MLIEVELEVQESSRRVGVVIEIYTTKEMMQILKFGKTKMNALLQSGEFPAVKIGGQYRITKEALEKWMLENQGKEIYL